ncbi:hypothetical protein CQW23_01264 [Capsicum baccatum]|uniref:Uncharacterized protein n=1 Tax=Capsicum baccatum TaxID=33114 RepID=A0A2G2XNH0_CAPBA|nr:hypothetical protein CQW23_01264 [Capsicum baccatum]
MDSGDGSVLKRRTSQQSLKYMVKLIQRNILSKSSNPISSINANIGDDVCYGRKRKMEEPSRVYKRKKRWEEKSIIKWPLVDEKSDYDFSDKESRPDVISSELEFKASTNENNDDPNGKTYRVLEL